MKRIEIEPTPLKEESKKVVMETIRRLKEETGRTYYRAGHDGGLTTNDVWYMLSKSKNITASAFLQLVTGLGGRLVIEIPEEGEEPIKPLFEKSDRWMMVERNNIRYRLRKQGVKVDGDTVYLGPNDNISMRRIATMISIGFTVVNVDKDGNTIN